METGDATGASAPLPRNARSRPRMACNTLYLKIDVRDTRYHFKASDLLPEGIRNTLRASRKAKAMPDKQDRYRKRKAEQGFQRIELLVPEAAAPYLKAYARALRDAHALGLELPLFEEISLSKRHTSHPVGYGTAPETRDQPKPRAPTANPVRNTTGAATPRPDFDERGFLDE